MFIKKIEKDKMVFVENGKELILESDGYNTYAAFELVDKAILSVDFPAEMLAFVERTYGFAILDGVTSYEVPCFTTDTTKKDREITILFDNRPVVTNKDICTKKEFEVFKNLDKVKKFLENKNMYTSEMYIALNDIAKATYAIE